MEPHEDAFGQEILDYWQDPDADIREIIEREDGLIALSGGPSSYFAPYSDWPKIDQEAMEYVRGRVLDIGCGAGRVCLYLQERGHDVVGIDNSPLAVRVARERGVADARVQSITQVSRVKLGLFETIVMLGNNFGLFGNPRRARWLLRRFYGMTPANGRIVAESLDVRVTDNPDHLAYQQFNRDRGRLPGQIRLRVLHRKIKGNWFDYLMVSPEEMREILTGTGWAVAEIIGRDDGGYIAAIEKSGTSRGQ